MRSCFQFVAQHNMQQQLGMKKLGLGCYTFQSGRKRNHLSHTSPLKTASHLEVASWTGSPKCFCDIPGLLILWAQAGNWQLFHFSFLYIYRRDVGRCSCDWQESQHLLMVDSPRTVNGANQLEQGRRAWEPLSNPMCSIDISVDCHFPSGWSPCTDQLL